MRTILLLAAVICCASFLLVQAQDLECENKCDQAYSACYQQCSGDECVQACAAGLQSCLGNCGDVAVRITHRPSHHHATNPPASEIHHPHHPHHGADNWALQFTHFKQVHKKKYASKKEEAEKFAIFIENMKRSKEMNRRYPHAKFGMTKFSDISTEEFRRTHLNHQPSDHLRKGASQKPKHHKAPAPTTLPQTFDWNSPDRNRTACITDVKDQGNCGSCWAFSAVEEVESMWILAGKPWTDLSVQQVVDCDTVDQGCNGGNTQTAYTYIEKAGGLNSDTYYPYTSGEYGTYGTCFFNKSQVVAHMASYYYATPPCNDTCAHQNEQEMMTQLYNVGPISVCVDADAWQNYQEGVLGPSTDCTSDYPSQDHCVQLTGWGGDQSINLTWWNVRNSWEADWGEDGYIRLVYGENTCGIADEATIVVI